MNAARHLIPAVLVALASCAPKPPAGAARTSESIGDASPQSRRCARAADGPAGAVTHVVIVWLKKPGDAATRDALIDAAQSLKSIPGVADVRAGRVMPSTRPVVDSTFDVGLVVTFTDEQAMRDYLTNPTHVKLLNEVFKPNADHYRVFDFTGTPAP